MQLLHFVIYKVRHSMVIKIIFDMLNLSIVFFLFGFWKTKSWSPHVWTVQFVRHISAVVHSIAHSGLGNAPPVGAPELVLSARPAAAGGLVSLVAAISQPVTEQTLLDALSVIAREFISGTFCEQNKSRIVR